MFQLFFVVSMFIETLSRAEHLENIPSMFFDFTDLNISAMVYVNIRTPSFGGLQRALRLLELGALMHEQLLQSIHVLAHRLDAQ